MTELSKENLKRATALIKTHADTINGLMKENNRLTSALARAHEALNRIRAWGGSMVRIFDREIIESDHPEIFSEIDEVLADKDGKLAFERWEKMEAVVEAARIVADSDCGHAKLCDAIEALSKLEDGEK